LKSIVPAFSTLVVGRAIRADGQREGGPRGWRLDAEERLAAHDAGRRKTGATPDGLVKADGMLVNVRLGPERVEGDAGNRQVLDSEPKRRRSDETATGLALCDYSPVLDFDPRLQVVRLPKAVLVVEALEVALLEPIGRRVVVVSDAQLERNGRQAVDRLRRNPGERRYRRLDTHRPLLASPLR
jgi:hypothetical protein